MINLFKYIKESLFDDEEEQMDKIDGAVMLDQIKKEDIDIILNKDIKGKTGCKCRRIVEILRYNQSS